MRVKELVPIFIISLILLPLVAVGETSSTLVIPPWNHCLGLHKVRQFHLDIYSGYRKKFNDPQGLFCTKLACKDDQASRRDDDELNVFGLNSGAHEIIYNKNLTSIGIVGGKGTGERQFNAPQSLTGDREGNIYVADTGNDRIVHLSYRNDDLVQSGIIRGDERCALKSPSGVCLSGGLLYVADTGNDRIVVFDTSGTVVDVQKPRLGAARLRRPYSIAVVSEGDRWLYYRDHFIAVVDSSGARLWKIGTHGNTLDVITFSELGRNGKFGHIAIDYYGNIYVTDPDNNVIHKLDRYLNYIVAIGERVAGDSQLDEPRGITIYRRFGQVFISERSGAQYYWIGTDILRLSADKLAVDPERGSLSINVSFLLTEHSTVSVRLEDEDGRFTVPLLQDHMLPCGKIERRLEIPRDDAGALAKCTFKLVVTAKPTYSSGAFLTVSRETPFLKPSVKTRTSSTKL